MIFGNTQTYPFQTNETRDWSSSSTPSWLFVFPDWPRALFVIFFSLCDSMVFVDVGVSLNGGNPKTPQNDHF